MNPTVIDRNQCFLVIFPKYGLFFLKIFATTPFGYITTVYWNLCAEKNKQTRINKFNQASPASFKKVTNYGSIYLGNLAKVAEHNIVMMQFLIDAKLEFERKKEVEGLVIIPRPFVSNQG